MARLVEPTVLYLLASGQARHGYEIMQAAQLTPIADGPLDPGAVYRALRSLEQEGCVVSAWQPGPAGPARRMYAITQMGLQRLAQWTAVLEQRATALQQFTENCRRLLGEAGMNLPPAAGSSSGEGRAGGDES